jgi:hypothetical protein
VERISSHGSVRAIRDDHNARIKSNDMRFATSCRRRKPADKLGSQMCRRSLHTHVS